MATALPLPNLDDRRWTDLVDEGRALIPFYAPGWTDHNVHDPGIMLIELFAWLAEMDLFAVNQITDAHRRLFLALAGVTPEPIRAAETLLELAYAPQAGAGSLALPAGIEFEGRDPFATPVRFRSRHDISLVPGAIAALLTGDGVSFRNLTAAWLRGEPIQPFGADPGPGAVFYIGIKADDPWEADASLSLGFALAQANGRMSRTERARITTEMEDAAAECRPPASPCEPDQTPDTVDAADGEDPFALTHHGVRLIWEALTGAGHWERLLPGEGVQDGTRSLTLTGRVVITPPAPLTPSTLDGRVNAPLRWLRVRVARGRHDAAPVLQGIAFNAVEAEQAVPAVAHLRIAPGAVINGVPPAPGSLIDLDLAVNRQGQIERLTFAVPVADRPSIRLLAYDAAARTISFEAAALARGSSAPLQQIASSDVPLMVESLSVQTREDDAWRAWRIQPDVSASSRSDADVIVTAETGVLTAGDGEQGRVIPFDALLVATADVTLAERGNLECGKVDRIADSLRNRTVIADLAAIKQHVNTISNVIPAWGGSAAETLDAAIARAQEERERPARAVTLDDHAALARGTPGARIARAEARANFHPGFPCLTAPGIVTLLLLPELPADRPEPTAGLLQLVAAYVNRRRVIGTRLEVAGPVYVPVTVRTTVETRPGVRAADAQLAIRDALDRFFHPLRGGPAGTGWPFGRDVYRSEVLQVIDEVPGVAHVLSLELIQDGGCPTCGNLCLGPTGLVDAGEHEVTVK